MKRQSSRIQTSSSELPPFFGQAALGDRLTHDLGHRKLPAVFLFAGPAQVGMVAGARWLAQISVCDQGDHTTACGTCADCRQVIQGTHPRIQLLRGAAENPITVDDVRRVTQSLRHRRSADESSWVIMTEVEYLTEAAANACLKFFEEPPAGVFVALTTSQPDRVPDTILSRTAIYRWHLTPPGQYPLAPGTGRVLSQQLVDRAAGRPEIWQAFHANPELHQHEAETIGQILEALDQAQPAAWQQALDAIPDEQVSRHFQLWELVLRELLLVKLGIPSRRLWPALSERFSLQVKNWPTSLLLERLERWQQRTTLLQQHVTPRLILADLLV